MKSSALKRKTIYQSFIMIMVYWIVMPVIAAQTKSALSIGKVADNLMDPVTVLMNFINTACVLFGGVFLFAALVKYFEHKRSPTMVPISTIVFLIIAGLVLIALPLVSYVSSYGVPYSFIRLK